MATTPTTMMTTTARQDEHENTNDEYDDNDDDHHYHDDHQEDDNQDYDGGEQKNEKTTGTRTVLAAALAGAPTASIRQGRWRQQWRWPRRAANDDRYHHYNNDVGETASGKDRVNINEANKIATKKNIGIKHFRMRPTITCNKISNVKPHRKLQQIL